MQIVGLRKKLGDSGKYIETVRGVGYRYKGKREGGFGVRQKNLLADLSSYLLITVSALTAASVYATRTLRHLYIGMLESDLATRRPPGRP